MNKARRAIWTSEKDILKLLKARSHEKRLHELKIQSCSKSNCCAVSQEKSPETDSFALYCLVTLVTVKVMSDTGVDMLAMDAALVAPYIVV